MNKFKVFFTFFAFLWLWLCGIGAIAQCFHARELAWLGVLMNAWALPIWMLMRFLSPQKYAGDARESPAFFAVLAGLAIALLADAERGWPVYLSIYNLFIALLYLHHFSAVAHPQMPQVDEQFPDLMLLEQDAPDKSALWSAAEHCEGENSPGLLVIFLRGPFCADSRRCLAQIESQREAFHRRGVDVSVFSVSGSRWPMFGRQQGDLPPVFSLDAGATENHLFIAPGAAPLWAWGWQSDAVRPSYWLVDNEGYIVWRALPGNYRALPSLSSIRDQLYRLEE